MTLSVSPVPRRWTRREYHEMGERGFFDGQRVELIGGEVVEMAPQRDAHSYTVRLAADALQKAFGSKHVLLIQMPLRLGGNSEPEPDIAVVKGTIREVSKHPTTAVLIVEVADTTLAYDRHKKSKLYAAAGIADYWIINLVEQSLEVRRNPTGKGNSAGYAEPSIHFAGDSIAPLALRRTKIKVSDLLP